MIAYSIPALQNLGIIKEARRWAKQAVITDDQLAAIQAHYNVSLYHPNWMIRVLLFVAGLLALSGVTGIFALMFGDLGATGLSVLCILYGAGSIIFLEGMFIKRWHYKSGITEAVLYHSCGFLIGGVAGLSDFDNTNLILITSVFVFALAAIRYLDLITTLATLVSLAALIFLLCYDAGGILRQLIPFVFLFVFTVIYWGVKRIWEQSALVLWRNNLTVMEVVSLIMIYLSTNYWVVREASIELLDLSLAEGEEIPFAGIFYSLTVAIPVLYFFVAIKNKDLVMLRVGMLVFALSVSTFKYYFIQLKNFASFPPRVIYINVVSNTELDILQRDLQRYCKMELQLFNARYRDLPFHPHLTLAFRDLKKANYEQAWNEFKDRSFSALFEVKSLMLLKHDGKVWQPCVDCCF